MSKNKLYGNWKILAPDGELLSIELKKRADWYLNKNLAEKVDDFTIRLNFEPKARKSSDDLYDLSFKENKCVCCGTTDLELLTKHHVVPSEYRKLFPVEIKSRNSHDIIPICRKCHDEYELTYANIKRQEIAEKYNIPLTIKYSTDIPKCVSIGNVILKHVDDLPKTRYEELYQKFCHLSGINNPTTFDIENYIEKNKDWSPPRHADLVMEKINTEDKLYEFVKMWRKDFIDNMKPKYMPKYWSVDRKIQYDKN
jgi:hypothetical protein